MRAAILILAAILVSCGGGGGGGGIPPPTDNAPATLRWAVPTQFEDNTALDPHRDIGLYEIHTSDNAAWGDNTLRAVVNPVDDLGNLCDTFDLRNLYAFGIGPGDNGTFLSMRSVGTDCAVSMFGKTIYWEAR